MKLPKNLFGIIIIVSIVVGMIVLNRWIAGQVDRSDLLKGKKVEAVPVESKPVAKKRITAKRYLGVSRKTVLDPSRKYSLNIFYGDGEEIARFKNNNGNVFDFEGAIPDGKVEFKDEARRTYGTEYYQNNQLHGLFQEYYDSGTLRKEAKYIKGKEKWTKEYYNDGIVRMEQDFQDMLRFSENKDVELGEGKVYYRNGKLMYEWNITNRNRGGYNRSYDQNGRMVAEKLFDENGRLIKKTTAVEYQKKK